MLVWRNKTIPIMLKWNSGLQPAVYTLPFLNTLRKHTICQPCILWRPYCSSFTSIIFSQKGRVAYLLFFPIHIAYVGFVVPTMQNIAQCLFFQCPQKSTCITFLLFCQIYLKRALIQEYCLCSKLPESVISLAVHRWKHCCLFDFHWLRLPFWANNLAF